MINATVVTKIKDLVVKQVEFAGNSLMCIQEKKTEEIFVGVNWILEGLGFDDRQIEYQRNKMLEDKVIFKGVQKFSYPSKGGLQEAYCINIKKLPIALAKIRLTPTVEKENPELVEKLELYQEECADVLVNHFLQDKKEKEEWTLARQVGVVDRNRMTYSIKTNLPESYEKQFAYGKYTNMVYQILFNKTASDFKIERNCKNPRDAFTKDELKLVDEAETIVTALVALGFTYNEIQIQLKRKFQTKLMVQ